MEVRPTSACPECGAALEPGETCRDRFNQGQLMEVEQPGLYAAHHLSVPTYMLQHNAYSREGWLQARELLRQFVEDGLAPQEARRRNRSRVDSRNRPWSLTRGPKLPGGELVRWTMTVAEVRLDTPEHYCGDVRRWAESVLADSAALVRSAR
jgi:hypothetical protein